MTEPIKDLVCGMTLDKDQAAATAEYQGHAYYFCTSGCKAEFEKDPKKYVQATGQAHQH